MNKNMIFYFDFVSPYSYLAQTQFDQLQAETGVNIEYAPVFLGGIHQALEVKSPPFIPSKAQWIVRDCHMWADQYNLALKWPEQFPFKTLPLLRVCVWLKHNKPQMLAHFVKATFKAIWEEGLDCHNLAKVGEHLHLQGLSPDEVMAGISEPVIKQDLLDSGDVAVEKGMFGLPVFEVDGKLYFGQDRLHFVKRALLGSPMVDGSSVDIEIIN